MGEGTGSNQRTPTNAPTSVDFSFQNVTLPCLYPARPAASRRIPVTPPRPCHAPASRAVLGPAVLRGVVGRGAELGGHFGASKWSSGGPRRAPDAGCRPFPPPASGAWLPDRILDAREGGFTPISCHIFPPPPLCPQPSARELPHLLVPRGERLAGEVSCRVVSATSKSCRTKSPWLLLPARVSASFLLFISEPEPQVIRLVCGVVCCCCRFLVVPERKHI